MVAINQKRKKEQKRAVLMFFKILITLKILDNFKILQRSYKYD